MTHGKRTRGRRKKLCRKRSGDCRNMITATKQSGTRCCPKTRRRMSGNSGNYRKRQKMLEIWTKTGILKTKKKRFHRRGRCRRIRRIRRVSSDIHTRRTIKGELPTGIRRIFSLPSAPDVCRMCETHRESSWTIMRAIWRATASEAPDSWTIWCRSIGLLM